MPWQHEHVISQGSEQNSQWYRRRWEFWHEWQKLSNTIDIFLSCTNEYFLSKNHPHTARILLSKMTFMPLCWAFSSPCAAGLTPSGPGGGGAKLAPPSRFFLCNFFSLNPRPIIFLTFPKYLCHIFCQNFVKISHVFFKYNNFFRE